MYILPRDDIFFLNPGFGSQMLGSCFVPGEMQQRGKESGGLVESLMAKNKKVPTVIRQDFAHLQNLTRPLSRCLLSAALFWKMCIKKPHHGSWFDRISLVGLEMRNARNTALSHYFTSSCLVERRTECLPAMWATPTKYWGRLSDTLV